MPKPGIEYCNPFVARIIDKKQSWAKKYTIDYGILKQYEQKQELRTTYVVNMPAHDLLSLNGTKNAEIYSLCISIDNPREKFNREFLVGKIRLQ